MGFCCFVVQDWEVGAAFSVVLILWGNKEYALSSYCNFYYFLLLLHPAFAILLTCRSHTCEPFHRSTQQPSPQKGDRVVCVVGENALVGYEIVFYLLALETGI